ncbi:hypothetical protein K502DRAFT_325150 [Neoconidiobolus thromboides FSU 785]|nr:hypothetical protein K502DRAFT_325150 [Neoconidiobolus thromboides FSU 785]
MGRNHIHQSLPIHQNHHNDDEYQIEQIEDKLVQLYDGFRTEPFVDKLVKLVKLYDGYQIEPFVDKLVRLVKLYDGYQIEQVGD